MNEEDQLAVLAQTEEENPHQNEKNEKEEPVLVENSEDKRSGMYLLLTPKKGGIQHASSKIK